MALHNVRNTLLKCIHDITVIKKGPFEIIVLEFKKKKFIPVNENIYIKFGIYLTLSSYHN